MKKKILFSEFKKQLSEFGLIQKEILQNMNPKKLYNTYKNKYYKKTNKNYKI